MARKKAGEQTDSQAAAQDSAAPQTAGSVKETQAQQTSAGETKAAAAMLAPAPAPAPASAEASAPRSASRPALRITAKPRKGFRRCGLHHPAAAVDHPEGRFSAAEIERLKAEPNLVVEDL